MTDVINERRFTEHCIRRNDSTTWRAVVLRMLVAENGHNDGYDRAMLMNSIEGFTFSRHPRTSNTPGVATMRSLGIVKLQSHKT
jgi:hypothetical protein